MSRRAKIVCTLGPATASAEQITRLVDAGLDVARLNLSHGTYAGHQLAYDRVRAASNASGRSVGILADLQGPKIRLGTFPGGPVRLHPGDGFTITTDDVPGDRNEASTTYAGLAGDVRPGDRLLIDDGRVMLQATGVNGSRVTTTVLVGGMISDHKGINLPGVAVSAPPLTQKDQADLRWAIGLGADMIALSFVRRPTDADAARAIMNECGAQLPLIAKIEKPEAVEALPEIVAAFDGIMAREKARPVIVATQMLESMISAPRPTRAEVSDVATAVDEGADAVMLSAETSVGEYPVEAVATMSRIICAAEEECLRPVSSLTRIPTTTGGAIARAAAEVGAIVGARALVAFTMTGETARRLARYRSSIPLLAFTSVPATRRQLALTWGVETFIVPLVDHTTEMVRQVEQVLLDIGRCEKGDKLVIVAGSPLGSPGKTNSLRVHRIGDPSSAADGLPGGPVVLVKSPPGRYWR